MRTLCYTTIIGLVIVPSPIQHYSVGLGYTQSLIEFNGETLSQRSLIPYVPVFQVVVPKYRYIDKVNRFASSYPHFRIT